jgi:hypothetical protein
MFGLPAVAVMATGIWHWYTPWYSRGRTINSLHMRVNVSEEGVIPRGEASPAANGR